MMSNSGDNFLKITYHGGSTKKGRINIYLNKPSPTFMFLMSEIRNCLFDQHKQPTSELRIYWIDEDKDEIEVINQCDYEIFSKRCTNRHLQVAPVDTSGNEPSDIKTGVSSATDPGTSSAVHPTCSCDGCFKKPIVGFRYKCIQCPDYDLCENCEAKHVHPEHSMLRIPNYSGDIQAWIARKGSSGRRHKRFSFAEQCPFVTSAASSCANTDTETKTTGQDAGKEQHHHGRHSRKVHRRHMQHGIFAHLYNMMQDLAEGGGPTMSDTENNASAEAGTESSAAPRATRENIKVTHEAVHSAVHAAATKAASVAAETAAHAATAAAKAAVETVFGSTEPEKHNSSKGATPKTPPSTPNSTNSDDPRGPDFTRSEQGNMNNASTANAGSINKQIPVLTSPILENVSQMVDPQYMKAGIQILNNFSEMFAKMLDPVEGGSDAGGTPTGCPFQSGAFSQYSRRNSTSSKASSNENASAALNTNKNVGENKVAAVGEEAKRAEANDTASIGIPKVISSQEKQTERSHIEETDWQIIENSSSIATPNESVDLNVAGAVGGSVDEVAPSTTAQREKNEINYIQLGKDLQAHLIQEQKREQQANATATANAPSSAPVIAPVQTVPAATNTEFNTVTTSTDSVGTATDSSIPVPEIQREIQMYHLDRHINNAVHSMMAMGFSNEGNWLTQLLVSVNGNIPQALDVMGAAQRST